ncbi:fungal-specific transcription factor domain-containing protein [Aspergillus granulosus]|uniref:Fungal-specific transcription factor domain-containing protein n=1 Tax=Aspergillus granulosus TaxID=176169 RepID=A0ABR4HN40_9EURO
MRNASSTNRDARPRFQPCGGTGQGNGRNRHRKQTNETRQVKESQCDANQDLDHPSPKRLKTTNDANEYRRQRNLKNLMMINRLESNIGRMEAHLQELGFNINNTKSTQTLLALAGSDNAPSPPSPPLSEPENISNHGSPGNGSYLGGMYTDSRTSHNLISAHIDSDQVASDFHGEELPLWDDFAGLLLPRCLIDTPTARGLRALSPEGMKWMGQKTGVIPSLLFGNHSSVTSCGSLSGEFPRKVFCPLPSKEEASSLLYEYLQNFNCLCPLFEQAELVSLFNQDNRDLILQAPALWASVNVVFALGIAFRIKDSAYAQTEHQRSWLFIKNAFSVYHDLCLGQPDLWSIQALLGMSIFFLGTMCAEPCTFLAATAIRMCQQLGLGATKEGASPSSQDLEQRRYIFWIAYCLDRETSLRFGKPPAQSDDDMSIGMPTEPPADNAQMMPTVNRHTNFNVFKAQCQLATIKGHLYKDLYSAAAKDRSLGEIMASVGTLDEKLQDWIESLPSDCQPNALGLPNISQPSISVMMLYLHYSYFHCIIAIHRLICSQRITIATDLLKKRGIDLSTPLPCSSKGFMSSYLCAHAARASIRLMKYIPEGHLSIIGILIYYPILALSTLSSTIIQNPRDASRLSDMKLIEEVEKFLSSQIVSIPNEGITQLRAYCANYRSAAETAVGKTMQFCRT